MTMRWKDIPLYLWVCGDESWLVPAKTQEEAYRKAIAHRLKVTEGETEEEKLQNAVNAFAHNDQLFEVSGHVDEKPYKGKLPEHCVCGMRAVDKDDDVEG